MTDRPRIKHRKSGSPPGQRKPRYASQFDKPVQPYIGPMIAGKPITSHPMPKGPNDTDWIGVRIRRLKSE